MSPVLAKKDLRKLIENKPPLFEGFIDLKLQLQPNGFDMTLREVAAFQDAGQLGVDNNQRKLPELKPLYFNGQGWLALLQGSYMITYNEIVHLPNNIMALGRPRSSLLRCGVTIGTAVWDAGYAGRSQSLMVVYNPQGFKVQRNIRMMQLIFMTLTETTEGYNGVYQGENIK